MQDSATFYVASIPTQEHLDPAYIECRQYKPNNTGPSAWHITTDRSKAYDFGSHDLAREFCDRLKEGEAYNLKNDGHLWHVANRI